VLITTSADLPVLETICLIFTAKASKILSIINLASRLKVVSFSISSAITWAIANWATPPPGTTPSITAARVAFNASSIRSFNSLTSNSVVPPTLITATPPDNLANLSCNFSLSYSDSHSLIWFLIKLERALTSASSPAPPRLQLCL